MTAESGPAPDVGIKLVGCMLPEVFGIGGEGRVEQTLQAVCLAGHARAGCLRDGIEDVDELLGVAPSDLADLVGAGADWFVTRPRSIINYVTRLIYYRKKSV